MYTLTDMLFSPTGTKQMNFALKDDDVICLSIAKPYKNINQIPAVFLQVIRKSLHICADHKVILSIFH